MHAPTHLWCPQEATPPWERTFQIDRQVIAAALDTTIEVYDWVSGTSFPLTVTMAWTGVGDKFVVKDHFQMKSKTFKVNYKFSGTFRDADTDGSVSDGASNFTPEPAVYADLANLKEGEHRARRLRSGCARQPRGSHSSDM